MAGLVSPSAKGTLGFVAAYFLATPLFALADLALGWPVRVAGLDDPVHRGIYYVVVFWLGVLARARPSLAGWLGMGESAANLTLLFIAVLTPIWSLADTVAAGGAPAAPLGTVSLGNLVLSGTALVVSFYRHQARAMGRKGRSRVAGL